MYQVPLKILLQQFCNISEPAFPDSFWAEDLFIKRKELSVGRAISAIKSEYSPSVQYLKGFSIKKINTE